MKKRVLFSASFMIAVIVTLVLFLAAQPVSADVPRQEEEIPRGGALYDNWIAATGQQAPEGNMPLWETQTNNTRSGPDTWRCVTCHGWDYQGKDGAYRAGGNFTGFPGVYQARDQGVESVSAAITGQVNPQHDFSSYLDEAAVAALATFITEATIDDNDFIDMVTLKVKEGDANHGKTLYDESCASCHGSDGQQLVFRFEGTHAYLGTLAVRDPWRLLHKTRFGTPGTPMPIGYELGWTPQDGRDVLLYAQGLPSGEAPAPAPSINDARSTQQPRVGGPASNIITGILTALGAMAAGLGFNIIVAAVLVGAILLVAWILRGR